MMISTTMLIVILMVEIAVDLTSIQITALNVYALKKEGVEVVQTAIKVGFLMGIVMISIITVTVPTMVEIAVDQMLIQIGAQYANVLKEGMAKGQLISK